MSVFPPLPVPDSISRTRPRRIAIASVDIAGPYHCGGVGAAYHGLALALAEAGHDVTVVYTHPNFHQGNHNEWALYFHARGIRFVHLPELRKRSVWYGNRPEGSLRCFEWLRGQQRFDVIHFPEWLGLAYSSVAAKRDGLAFADTTLCVGTHGCQSWSRSADEALVSPSDDPVVDFMERNSVELADVVVSPSQYLLHWMSENGWSLPPRTYVANNILQPLEPAVRERARANSKAGQGIGELVFFGRLERRKGLPFFCDVIDHLQPSPPVSLTFLGSRAPVDGQRSEEYLGMRAKRWKIAPALLMSFGRTQALEYLSGPGRLAVIPSQLDNSPCAVQECLQEGIPFLASDRGGIPELVHPDDRERTSAPIDVSVFVSRLGAALQSGQHPVRPAIPFQTTRDQWIGWHETLP